MVVKCQCHKVKQAITGRRSKPCGSKLGKEQMEVTDDAGIVYFLTPGHAKKLNGKYPGLFSKTANNPKVEKVKKAAEKELTKRKTKDRWFSVPRVLGAGETKTLTEAVLADLWDLVPVGGDLSNVGRIVAIGAGKGVKRKGAKIIVQSIDAVGGVIPVIGNIIPANTILLITDKVGGRGNPEGSITIEKLLQRWKEFAHGWDMIDSTDYEPKEFKSLEAAANYLKRELFDPKRMDKLHDHQKPDAFRNTFFTGVYGGEKSGREYVFYVSATKGQLETLRQMVLREGRGNPKNDNNLYESNPEDGEGFLSRSWAATKEVAKKGARKGAELAKKSGKRGAGYLAGKLKAYSERENPTWPKYIIGLETKESSSVEDAEGYDYDTVNKLLHDPNWQKMKSGQGWEYAELVKIDGFGNETPIEQVSFDNPARPPKYWWDRMVKEIKASMPKYSMEQIRDTIGDIWYHKLSPKKKQEIVARENTMVPERHNMSYENLIGETVEDENGNVGTALGPGDEPETIEVRFFDTGDVYSVGLDDIRPYLERSNPTKSQAQKTAEWHRVRGKRARVVQTSHDNWEAFVDGKRSVRKKKPPAKKRGRAKPKAKRAPKKKEMSDTDMAKKIKRELEKLLE